MIASETGLFVSYIQETVCKQYSDLISQTSK